MDHGWRGPALSGVCLGKTIDFSQTRGRAGLPTRRSVHVVKALRSWIELAIAHPTTSADSADDVVVSVQVQKSGDILPFGVQASDLMTKEILSLAKDYPKLSGLLMRHGGASASRRRCVGVAAAFWSTA